MIICSLLVVCVYLKKVIFVNFLLVYFKQTNKQKINPSQMNNEIVKNPSGSSPNQSEPNGNQSLLSFESHGFLKTKTRTNCNSFCAIFSSFIDDDKLIISHSQELKWRNRICTSNHLEK